MYEELGCTVININDILAKGDISSSYIVRDAFASKVSNIIYICGSSYYDCCSAVHVGCGWLLALPFSLLPQVTGLCNNNTVVFVSILGLVYPLEEVLYKMNLIITYQVISPHGVGWHWAIGEG